MRCLALPLTLLLACNQAPTSNTKNVASPGSIHADNTMMYLKGDVIHLAKCLKNQPLTREACEVTDTSLVEPVSNHVIGILQDRYEEAKSLLDLEIHKLKTHHPLIIDYDAKLSERDDEKSQQLADKRELENKLIVIQENIAILLERLEALEEDEVLLKNEIINKGSTPERIAALAAIQKDLGFLKKSLEAKQRTERRLIEDIAEVAYDIAIIEGEILDLSEHRKFEWQTLEVDSPLSGELNARMARLSEKTNAVINFTDLLASEDITYRLTHLSSMNQELFLMFQQAIQQTPFLPFSDDFSDGIKSHWKIYKSRTTNFNQIHNGSLRMESDSGGLNEAILSLPLQGQSSLLLEFIQQDIDDRETSLPNSFQGHRNGDGVAISTDGNQWYTIVNANSLDTPSRTLFRIDLDEQIRLIQNSYDSEFNYTSPFYIKFQQYEANPRPDTRDWDNITIKKAPTILSYGPGTSNQRLQPSGYINSFPINVTGLGIASAVSLELKIDATTDFDDYTIKLTHPDGTQILVQQNNNGDTNLHSRGNRLVRFGDQIDVALPAFSGLVNKPMTGTWTVTIIDDDGDAFNLKHLQIHLATKL